MRNIIILFFVSTFFFSCEENFKLDLGQTPSHLVIEGLVTNQPGYQAVKISRTADFYSSGHTPRVTNALVTVEDDLGNIYNFVHNPNDQADSIGVYVPQVSFTGTVGRTYKLTVEVDGETYTAQDELFAVTKIDSLNYQINKDEKNDPTEENKFYEVRMYTREPQDETNYYLFKFYRNDSLRFANDSDIYYSDDQFLAEKIDGVSSPIFYGQDDLARVEMYSLSRFGFVYFDDLSSLINSDGGMFGPIPASPRTNLSNGALGFFQVSAIDIRSIMIE